MLRRKSKAFSKKQLSLYLSYKLLRIKRETLKRLEMEGKLLPLLKDKEEYDIDILKKYIKESLNIIEDNKKNKNILLKYKRLLNDFETIKMNYNLCNLSNIDFFILVLPAEGNPINNNFLDSLSPKNKRAKVSKFKNLSCLSIL